MPWPRSVGEDDGFSISGIGQLERKVASLNTHRPVIETADGAENVADGTFAGRARSATGAFSP